MSAQHTTDAMANSAVGIELRRGTLVFGDKTVFKNLDLDVPAGRTT